MTAEPAGNPEYSPESLWNLLDPGEPGLEEMAAAMASGDGEAAESAYLAYQRRREAPVLPWIHSSDESPGERRAEFDFLTETPRQLTWRDRERGRELVSLEKGCTSHRLEGIRPSPYNVVELADLLLENKVMLVYHPEDGVQDLGPEWDWEHIPPGDGQGRRWTLSLPYQYFLFVLGQAYWATGEERYIAKLVWIFNRYFDYVGGRSDWIWLPDMQLARCYQQLIPFILSWEGLPPRDLCRLRFWLATTCAESMEAVRSAPGNQLLFNGLGILWLGVGMPEFRRAGHWRALGWEQIGSYFGEGAFYPDGTSKENSFGYIIGASTSAIEAVDLARNNGWPYPGQVEEAMVKRAEFLADCVKPDGTCPWTGDSRRRSPRDYVSRIAGPRGRGDLEHAVSGGERGTPPDHTSSWYAWQGLAVMRSGWGKKANYLMFDVGPLGEVHAHEGKLAVEVAAYGRSLIEDLGIHSYSREAAEIPYYDLFGNTPGHNTVIVDGASQMRLITGPKTVEEPLGNTWVSTGVCDYLEGEYGNGWGEGQFGEPMSSVFEPEKYEGRIDTSVAHHRSVVYVKGKEPGDCEYWVITDRLSGSGQHTYEQLFHLVPGPVAADPATGAVSTASEGLANIAILPAATDGVEMEVVEGRTEPAMQGWYCGDGPRPVPAPCVVYRQRGAPPVCFQTVLWPQRPGDSRLPGVSAEGEPGSGWLRVRLPDGAGEDLCCSAAVEGTHELGDLSFDGIAAVMRFDRQGIPAAREVIGDGPLRGRGEGLTVEPGKGEKE